MKQDTIYSVLKTPIGPLTLVASEEALCEISFGKAKPSGVSKGQNTVLKQAEKELKEYFKGKRQAFDVPLSAKGTVFQKRAWRALKKIPYGKTLSYGEQARKIKSSPRAVGGANHRNPLSIVVPCHRVIGQDGSLVGFGGGLKTKKYLLDLEKAHSQG